LATADARRHVPPEAGAAGGQSTYLAPTCREHTASLTDFGGVGDGTTSNTAAFRKAVDHLSQYSGEGGGGSMLYVPAGKWLTAPFNLTSHFTLFLHSDAVILASQVGFLGFLQFCTSAFWC
jgi:polygalacturonase